MKNRKNRWLVLGLAGSLLCGLLLGGCGDDKKSQSIVSPSPSVTPAVTATPAPQMAKAVKVQADGGLNIRSKPSTEGDILGLAEDGSLLPLLVDKATDNWYQIYYEGKTAYVSADYAQVQEITLEEYNRLKEGGSASSPTPAPDPTSAPTPTPVPKDDPDNGTFSPTSSQPGNQSQDSQDGE